MEPAAPLRGYRGPYVVALCLAVSIGIALNVFSIGVLVDAVTGAEPGLSENATQILTGWGGGIIGVIGAVVGYNAGAASVTARNEKEREP